MRVPFQQADGCDYHPGRADATLRAAAFDERLLHRVQLSSTNRNCFDRLERAAFDLRYRHETTVHQLPVDQNAARAAFAFATTFFGSGEIQLLAQYVEQTLHGKGFEHSPLAVNVKGYFQFVCQSTAPHGYFVSSIRITAEDPKIGAASVSDLI